MGLIKIIRNILDLNSGQWLLGNYDDNTRVSPLAHTENTVLVFFIVIALSTSLILMGILPSIIILYGYWMARKSGDFEFIVESRKNIARLTYLVMTLVTVGSVVVWFNEGWLGDLYWYVPATAGWLLLAQLVRYLLDPLYFNIVKRHDTWVVNNGIFSTRNTDRRQTRMAQIKGDTTSIVDELQKISDLKDKGVINNEEFLKLKEKILH